MTPETGAALAAGRPAYSLYVILAVFPAVAVCAGITHQYLHLALAVAMTVLAFFAIRIVDRSTNARVWEAAIAFSKERLVTHAGRVNQMFGQLPSGSSAGGYLYAAQFDTGAIKVGQTLEPRSRLRKHRRDADAYGVSVIDFWLSQPHAEFIKNETALLASCSGLATRRKNEYFHGLSLGTVVQLAGRLSMTPGVERVSR